MGSKRIFHPHHPRLLLNSLSLYHTFPLSELNNPIPNATLTSHLHLFKIITPINVDWFQELLTSHPNQPLVGSVCHGLREGFLALCQI